MKYSTLFLSCFSSLFMISAHLYSEEQEHAQVEARALPAERIAEIQEQRAAEAVEEIAIQESSLSFSGARPFFASCDCDCDCDDVSLYFRKLAMIINAGETVEMEDGTQWRVASSDSYKTQYWRVGQRLSISPNDGYFSSSGGTYYLTNKKTNTYVRADLARGPALSGKFSQWIEGIDVPKGHLFLKTETHKKGTSWIVSSTDRNIFKEWRTTDYVIVGVNNSWLSSYDSILINVYENTYVRAKRF